MSTLITCGINSAFAELSPTLRQIAHVLSTRSPLDFSLYCYRKKSRSTCMSYPRRQRSFRARIKLSVKNDSVPVRETESLRSDFHYRELNRKFPIHLRGFVRSESL